jgi:hypothetical protein
MIEGKKYILKISYNDEILYFNILEENSFPIKEYRLYNNYEDLKQIDKYFSLFDTIEEIFISMKRLKSNNSISLEKGEQEMKIKIVNTLTNKHFYMNIPMKKIDIDNKIDNLVNHISSLNKKIDNLESEINYIKNENNTLKQKVSSFENKIKTLEQKLEEKLKKFEKIINEKENQVEMFKNSDIIKTEEDINLILSWFEKKPIKIDLLLNSKVDGDLNTTFYEKCLNKCPTMVFVRTTENLRFGGFTSVTWPETENKRDDKSFLFSLDTKKKYKIKDEQKDNAIFYCRNISFCFGSGCDLYISNNCTSNFENQVGNVSYDVPSENELNNGHNNFKVLNYEVYNIIFN